VEIGATPSVVGELRSYSVDEQATADDVSAMGSCDSVFEGNTVTTTITLGGHLDAADAGQIEAAIGTSKDVVVQTSGAGTGLPQMKVTAAVITGVQTSAEYGGRVEFSITAQGGTVDRTTQV
jgi:hypothetical protein